MVENLINKNFKACTEEENILCKTIEEMSRSIEIKEFIQNLENALKDNVQIFSYRIKAQFSALRTYRLANYKKAEQLHDLLGILIVVDRESEIINIENIIREYLNEDNAQTYNLLKEKEFKPKKYNEILEEINDNQYNELLFNDINTWLEIPNGLEKLLPPFSYNILCEKTFKDISKKVPIEIRIQTKEDFITTESYYYTIHKNDSLKLNLKIPLLCMNFRILRRMTKLAFEEKESIKKQYEKEIEELKKESLNFFKENEKQFNNIFMENANLINCWKNKLPIYDFKTKK